MERNRKEELKRNVTQYFEDKIMDKFFGWDEYWKTLPPFDIPESGIEKENRRSVFCPDTLKKSREG